MFHCEQDLLSNLIVLSPNNARHKFRQYIFEAWDWKCAYCGEQLTSQTATIDHIIPKFKGGQHIRVNMCCCCSPCNKSKATSKLEDWYTEENEHYCEERFVKLKQWC